MMQMRNVKRFVLLSGLFLLLQQVGWSQQTQQMGLQECLQYALDHNTNVLNAALDEESGHYQVQEVRSQALPQINASGQFSDNLIRQVIIVPGELTGGQPGTVNKLEVGQKYNMMGQIQATQQLYNQSVFEGLKAAKTSEEYYRLKSNMTKEQILEAVSSAYYQVFITQQQQNFLADNLKQVQKLMDIAQQQYEQGLIKKTDLNRMQVNKTNIETQLSQVSNQYDAQLNNFKNLLGMQIEDSLQLTGGDVDVPEHLDPNMVAVSEVPEHRLSYKTLQKQSELLEQQRKSIVAGFYPTLSAFANYSYTGVSNKFDYFKSSANSTTTWYPTASIGLTLNIPIFDGLNKYSRVQQSRIDIEKLENQKRSTRNALSMEYVNARNSYHTSFKQIKSQEENMQLAKEVYQQTQDSYHQGLASLTDLLNAETSMMQAQNQYSSALLQFKIAEIQLIKSKGELESLIR